MEKFDLTWFKSDQFLDGLFNMVSKTRTGSEKFENLFVVNSQETLTEPWKKEVFSEYIHSQKLPKIELSENHNYFGKGYFYNHIMRDDIKIGTTGSEQFENLFKKSEIDYVGNMIIPFIS